MTVSHRPSRTKALLAGFALALAACTPALDDNTIGALRVAGGSAWLNDQTARDGMAVRLGDSVSTGPGSSLLVVFNDGGFLQLDENTDPEFSWFEQGKCILIRIFKGQAYASKESACIQDPRINVVLNSQVNILVSSESSTLTVVEGHALAREPQPISLGASEQVEVSQAGAVEKRTLDADQMESVVNWREKYHFQTVPQSPAWPLTPHRARQTDKPASSMQSPQQPPSTPSTGTPATGGRYR